MSSPGVLWVTIGSKSGSKNMRANRSTRVATVSPGSSFKSAPFRTAISAASITRLRSRLSRNLRAVRLLYGPVLIQNSFV